MNISKINKIKNDTLYSSLTGEDQASISHWIEKYRLTFQESRILIDCGVDFHMWGEKPLSSFNVPRKHKSELIKDIKGSWDNHKKSLNDYDNFKAKRGHNSSKLSFAPINEKDKVLGRCPVASEKTLCCNLITLDAFKNCGLDCSYCSIQSFYTDNKVFVENNIELKLDAVNFDPNTVYHVGTGQSSDSLLWGNKDKVLERLLNFARKKPNLIIELKTKINRVNELINLNIPKNIICTWSLNPQTIIENEEHQSASLDQRIMAARKVADGGNLVGFHLHPMVYYHGWENDYSEMIDKIISNFTVDEVALISIGTLTFTKKVISQIRKRGAMSKILQMPLVESEGKLSYPREVKLALFKYAYNCFSSWHNKVFFYLCMENKDYWQPVFGKDYQDNIEFEIDMKKHYLEKIYPGKELEWSLTE
jgi:spore photoproduct lyase